jgi:hypothetical protein
MTKGEGDITMRPSTIAEDLSMHVGPRTVGKRNVLAHEALTQRQMQELGWAAADRIEEEVRAEREGDRTESRFFRARPAEARRTPMTLPDFEPGICTKR